MLDTHERARTHGPLVSGLFNGGSPAVGPDWVSGRGVFGAALVSVSLSAAPPGLICGKSEDFTLDL